MIGEIRQIEKPDLKYVCQSWLYDFQAPDRERIITLYAEKTKRKAEEVGRDIDRDKWMSVEEALEYGLIGKIIKKP